MHTKYKKNLHLLLVLSTVACGRVTPSAQPQALTYNDLRLQLSDTPDYKRLLLCSREANSCRPALLDTDGQEVVFAADAQHMSRTTAIKGYTLGALAWTAIPVTALVSWKLWSRHSKRLLKQNRDLVEMQRSVEVQEVKVKIEAEHKKQAIELEQKIHATDRELKEALRKVNTDFRQDEQKLFDDSIYPHMQEVDKKLAENVHISPFPSLAKAITEAAEKLRHQLTATISENSEYVEELQTSKREKMQKISMAILNLAEHLKVSNAALAARVANASDSFQALKTAKTEAAKLDEIFATELVNMKKGFTLSDDDLLDFQAKLNNSSLTMEYFAEVVTPLHYLERKRQLLVRLKAGELQDIIQLQDEITKLNIPTTKLYRDNDMKLYYELFPEDKVLFEELASVSPDEVPGFLWRFEDIKATALLDETSGYAALYREAFPRYQEIMFRQKSVKLQTAFTEDKIDLDAEIAQVEEEISAARDAFLRHKETHSFVALDDNIDGLKNLQQKIKPILANLDAPPPSQRIDEFEVLREKLLKEIDEEEKHIALKLQENAEKQKQLDALPSKAEQMQKIVASFADEYTTLHTKLSNTKHEQETRHTARLREFEDDKATQAEHLRQKLDKLRHKDKQLVRESEELNAEQRQQGKLVASLLLGSGAVLQGIAVAIDRHSWGYEARQQHRHWQLVWHAGAAAAEDVVVKDLQEILQNIAALGSYTINPAAQSLLQAYSSL